MNDWQAVKRAKRLVQSHRWRGASAGNIVWPMGSVLIVPRETPIEVVWKLKPPFCLLSVGVTEADAEFPELKNSSLSAVLGTSVPGDKYSERALIGGGGVSRDDSTGAGLLQLQNELNLVLNDLSGLEGFNIQSKGDSQVSSEHDAGTGYIVWREHLYSMVTTTEYADPPVETLAGSEAAGTVTLTWTAPPSGFGLVEYRIRRVAGNVPAVLPTDGTDVGTVPAGTETSNDIPGTGTFTYSVFAYYDVEGNDVPLSYSDCEVETVAVP